MREDTREKLRTFLRGLPPHYVLPLAAAVEQDRLAGNSGLPHQLILDDLRPALTGTGLTGERTTTPRQVFSAPFEDILVAERPLKRPGRIASSSVEAVWHWLGGDLAPAVHREICARLAEAVQAGDVAAIAKGAADLHRNCAAALLRALGDAVPGTPRHSILAERLGGGDVVEDARDMALVLGVAGDIEKIRKRVPQGLRTLSEEQVAALSGLIRELAEQRPESVGAALHVIMGRLAKPWDVLRLVARLRSGDGVCAGMDYSSVTELLFTDLEEVTGFFHRLSPARFDPVEVVERLRAFADIANGIARLLDAPARETFNERLLRAKAAAAEKMEILMERAPRAVMAALPYQTIGAFGRGRRRPDLSRHPDVADSEHALRTACLIEDCRDIAADSGFKGAYCEAVGELREALIEYGRALVHELDASNPETRARGLAFLDLAVTLTAQILSPEEADLLRRRAPAAPSDPALSGNAAS